MRWKLIPMWRSPSPPPLPTRLIIIYSLKSLVLRFSNLVSCSTGKEAGFVANRPVFMWKSTSVLIGLTLAVDERFKILLIVVIFHRMLMSMPHDAFSDSCNEETFEGLGIGSRLAYLELPETLSWVRIAGAVLYGVTTPIGIAAGLGIRTTYNPNTPTASIISGVMDSLSAGILIYTGTVEVGLLPFT